jgi:hypothetical protein
LLEELHGIFGEIRDKLHNPDEEES